MAHRSTLSSLITSSLLACSLLACGLTACDDSGGGADPISDPDAGTGQMGQVDMGSSDAGPPDAAQADAALPDAALPDQGPPPTAGDCFGDLLGPLSANYDAFDYTLGRHCQGTNHQDIQGVQRVVFLGDSVTRGTPPTPRAEFYRTLVSERLKGLFGDDLIVDDCSSFGARTDDFLIGQGQIPQCFGDAPDPRTTLVIFTTGGNDIFAWAQDDLSLEAAFEESDKAAQLLDDAVAWLTDDTRFPNGSYVIYANPFEYTDATGDLASCELAERAGITDNWLVGAPAVLRFQEQFMEIATRHRVDMIFTLEAFCGHGFHYDDPEGLCYRGPEAEPWFDLTCIHPNPTGHAAIADMFMAVVEE